MLAGSSEEPRTVQFLARPRDQIAIETETVVLECFVSRQRAVSWARQGR